MYFVTSNWFQDKLTFCALELQALFLQMFSITLLIMENLSENEIFVPLFDLSPVDSSDLPENNSEESSSNAPRAFAFGKVSQEIECWDKIRNEKFDNGTLFEI